MSRLFLGTTGLLIISFIIAAVTIDSQRPELQAHANTKGMTHELTTYKSATCGCCGNWVGYMKNKGYKLEVINTEDVESIKEKYGIPQGLYSCHTTIVNDGEYFIEGHIPEESIARLLETTPSVEGIGMPGMPSSSPGMPGAKEAPFEIMQLNKTNELSIFEVI